MSDTTNEVEDDQQVPTSVQENTDGENDYEDHGELIKVFTAIEDPDQQIHVQVMNLPEDTPIEVVSDFASDLVADSIAKIQTFLQSDAENLENEEVEINTGSLYDDVAFELAIYVSQDQIVKSNNLTFGKIINPESKYADVLAYVVEKLENLLQNMHLQNSETAEQTNTV